MTPQPRWLWRALVSRFVTALAIVSVATAGTLGYAYWFANDQFTHHSPRIDIPPGVLADGSSTAPANYLIVGSDTRAFVKDPIARAHFGDPKYNTGQRADVIMIAHVDPKAPGRGFLVSIPRDTWAAVPGHGSEKINGAYNYGPALLINTIKSNFGIDITHYLELDFATFSAVVNAIGTVDIYFPTAAYDTETGLEVKAPGCVALDGVRALAYARSRYYHYKTASGYKVDGRYDLGRIQRQQYFIRSLTQEAINKGARNPLTARNLVQKTVPHIAHDSRMSLQDFLLLARSFRNVDPAALQMATIPTERQIIDRQDAQVVLKAEAQPILDRLKSFTPGAKPKPLPKIAHAQIRVQVLNGSGVRGSAGSTSTALLADGFAPGSAVRDADRSDYTRTEVRYAPGAADKARVIAAYLGGAGTLVALSSAPAGADVIVVLGRDFVGVAKPGSHPKPPAGSTATTVPPNPGTTPGVTASRTPAGRPAVGCG